MSVTAAPAEGTGFATRAADPKSTRSPMDVPPDGICRSMGIEDRLRALAEIVFDERRFEDHMAQLRRIKDGMASDINMTRRFMGFDGSGAKIGMITCGVPWETGGQPEPEQVVWVHPLDDDSGAVPGGPRLARRARIYVARSRYRVLSPMGIEWCRRMDRRRRPHRHVDLRDRGGSLR